MKKVLMGCALLACVLAMVGCGRHATPAPKATPAAAQVPLPDWAPKDPSPEFLRAAKVLKPIPLEVRGSAAAEPGISAKWSRYCRTLVPAWELLGSLGEARIGRFTSSREVRVPVRDLEPAARTHLDGFFEARRQLSAESQGEEADYLVELYKMGAARDLSNVEVAFAQPGNHSVNLRLLISAASGPARTLETTIARR